MRKAVKKAVQGVLNEYRLSNGLLDTQFLSELINLIGWCDNDMRRLLATESSAKEIQEKWFCQFINTELNLHGICAACSIEQIKEGMGDAYTEVAETVLHYIDVLRKTGLDGAQDAV